MEDLLMNIHGDTCRKIIEDLLKQIKDYKRFRNSEDEPKIKKLTDLVKKPIKIYNKYHSAFTDKYEIPKI